MVHEDLKNRVQDQKKLKWRNENKLKWVNETYHWRTTFNLTWERWFSPIQVNIFLELELKSWRSFIDPKSLFIKSKVKQAVN